MLERATRPWWSWLGLSALIIVLDLATKAWVSSDFRYGETREVLPFFNLVLVHNTGAAFSFLAGESGWQRWFFTLVTIVICAALLVMLRRTAGNRLFAAALALVLGGALGNLYDRLTLGHVVDFVQLHALGYYFPSFNVADSAITVGVVLLIWDGMLGQGGHHENLSPLPEEKQ
jgi:signal peptidase II